MLSGLPPKADMPTPAFAALRLAAAVVIQSPRRLHGTPVAECEGAGRVGTTPRFRPGNPGTNGVKTRRSRQNRAEIVELFRRAFPSHGRGRRFNPYSAHQINHLPCVASVYGRNFRSARALVSARAGWQPAATGKMDAAHFAGFWLRHQRIGTRSTSNLFPARALRLRRACLSKHPLS